MIYQFWTDSGSSSIMHIPDLAPQMTHVLHDKGYTHYIYSYFEGYCPWGPEKCGLLSGDRVRGNSTFKKYLMS